MSQACSISTGKIYGRDVKTNTDTKAPDHGKRKSRPESANYAKSMYSDTRDGQFNRAVVGGDEEDDFDANDFDNYEEG